MKELKKMLETYVICEGKTGAIIVSLKNGMTYMPRQLNTIHSEAATNAFLDSDQRVILDTKQAAKLQSYFETYEMPLLKKSARKGILKAVSQYRHFEFGDPVYDEAFGVGVFIQYHNKSEFELPMMCEVVFKDDIKEKGCKGFDLVCVSNIQESAPIESIRALEDIPGVVSAGDLGGFEINFCPMCGRDLREQTE